MFIEIIDFQLFMIRVATIGVQICVVFLTVYSHAQNSNGSVIQNKTAQLDTLLTSYKSERLAEIDTLLDLTKSKTDLIWLNLLPSVNYDLDRNALNVGVNFNSFATYSQQKQRNKIERLKLEESLNNRLENDLLRLEADYLKIQSDVENITSEVKNFELYEELYTLKKDQYDNNKINLEVWLNFQKSYESAYLSLINKISNLEQRTIRFYGKIKSPAYVAELNILYELSISLKSFRHEQR
ncbi:TolC family protein [Aureibaculum sp. 2210JD6-5]|uniref:TolC family protein n=1 Tax=Aureibaculum sp. 2210JD6-5 TaxID=3103957 RepID=UPI002AAE0A23|nr:TolC family protein [Aureibaculum sp. 2210JD6-5]MDY7394043.1 TolC family protein [Aureibaculum sp. 2210JD6-5]